MFPNASIIIDKFHLIQLISRSLNKTRIKIMKYDKINYNKMKSVNANEYITKRIMGHSIQDITEKVYTKRYIEDLLKEVRKIS